MPSAQSPPINRLINDHLSVKQTQRRRHRSKGAICHVISGNPQARLAGVRGVAKIFSGGALISSKSCLRPQNTNRQRRWLFHCQNKTNKQIYSSEIFLFSVHTIIAAQQ